MNSLFHERQHDHGGDGTSVACQMNMMLHFSTCERILWAGWITDTIPKFVFSAIGIFMMAMAYEGLKYYRETLYQQKSVSERAEGTKGPVSKSLKQILTEKQHIAQTGLHFVQVGLSYILMLIIMLANLYFWLAILLGAMCGYYLFGWLRQNTRNDNECCY